MEDTVIQAVKQGILESVALKQRIEQDSLLVSRIAEAASICIQAYQNGNKLIFAGNGGSAADAQHLAAELVGRYQRDREPLSAISLTTDSSMLTALANDYSYSAVFARQLRANGRKGDVFVGITTSGMSGNVIEAFQESKRMAISTIGLTGCNRGNISDLCDCLIIVPSDNTPRIQETHIMIGHIICELIEETVFFSVP